MGAAYITYSQAADLGPLQNAVTGSLTSYDTLASVTASSTTLTGVVTCPFRNGGVARIVAPDDNTIWNFGTAASTPDAASSTRQLFMLPAGVVEYVHVPYGAYPAVKTA